MLTKIDHIGIAVRSIVEARKFYEQALGLVCEHQETVESQKVKTAFFTVGDVHIELLEPTHDDSPIAVFLAKKGEGIHHIAYQSDNIGQQLQDAADQGCTLIHEKPIQGAGGKEIAFLHPKSSFGVLTEFCCPSKEHASGILPK
ncbi:MAG: methylmalonyl-CoA epimerase [Proteobacteria bacterium]|nr:methylmalonyl-CoA epimerase [Pseudomonadota bacterium]MBU1639222.1 methylmalonyl-CoA epimerase [Pseudomonadota bacterium]